MGRIHTATTPVHRLVQVEREELVGIQIVQILHNKEFKILLQEYSTFA